MKIQLLVKDNNLMDSFNMQIEHLTEDEQEEFAKCKKLIQYDEYIKVEFDSETGEGKLKIP
jgi:hypothetical protein